MDAIYQDRQRTATKKRRKKAATTYCKSVLSRCLCYLAVVKKLSSLETHFIPNVSVSETTDVIVGDELQLSHARENDVDEV